MSNVITREQLDSVSYESVLKLREIKQLRQSITDALTLKQFKSMMFKTHIEFAHKVTTVSKSKAIAAQAARAARIIELWNDIKAGA